MGQKFVDFFSKAEILGGEKSKMRLAILTGTTQQKAEKLVENDENIKLFEKAYKQIEKEYK